jgi:hypothetical protein
MNWDAIGALAEAIGAAAVIVTLAYLAVQIRQNTRMNASALRQSFYDYTTRQMLHGTDSTAFSALLAKSTMTDESLSPGEMMQMLRVFQAVFVGYQGAYFQHRRQALDEDDWKTCRALLRSFWLFDGKAHTEVWEQLRSGGFLDDEFIAECELLRAEAEHYVQELEEKDLGFRSTRTGPEGAAGPS